MSFERYSPSARTSQTIQRPAPLTRPVLDAPSQTRTSRLRYTVIRVRVRSYYATSGLMYHRLVTSRCRRILADVTCRSRRWLDGSTHITSAVSSNPSSHNVLRSLSERPTVAVERVRYRIDVKGGCGATGAVKLPLKVCRRRPDHILC
jgi:hypothetical protein